MIRNRLSRDAVRRTAPSLLGDLGRADRARLESLLALTGPDGRLRLGEALGALFPGQAREAALTAFRQLRGRIKEAAKDASVAFELAVDSQTRAAPDERWCWFAGEDGALAAVARLDEPEIAGIRREPQDILAPTDMRDGKPVVRYFVSYAHKDEKHKNRLMDLLRDRLACAPHHVFEAWDDREIVAGEGWHDEIQRAIARSHFGILLVSPALLASKYITKHELPSFVATDPSSPLGAKRAIPVALKRVPFGEGVDAKGLKELQVFHDTDGKSFAERRGNQCDLFADALFGQILKATAKLLGPGAPEAAGRRGLAAGPDLDRHLRRPVDRPDSVCFVPTEGVIDTLDKLAPDAARNSQPGERRDALDFLEEWVRNPQAQPYCALLGEYGMGKTTTCQAFTKRLLDARETEPDVPAPIYLDLRHVGDAAKSEPDLLTILDTVLKRTWRGGRTERELTAADVVRLVQEEGALAIFDGLDEVLVHLSPAAGQRFTREIFRILPPNRLRKAGDAAATPAPAGRTGRLLVTCRTHYFRTLREQKTHLTTEDRDGVRAEHYRVFVLLPFTEAQIRTYLEQTLPGEDPNRVLELIRAVHNLPELAERPYTLSLIAEHIPAIERWKLEGRRVTGVDLYRSMVLSWLERDAGKHQFTPDHKQVLMEHFAAELWRSGKRAWTVGDVEQWLVDLLRARPELAAHYEGKERDLLKEDLRTATFLVRQGESEFRFAHTSLQEFFLAAYLYRALAESRADDWSMARPSAETLDFLGQMLDGDEGRDRALATLKAMRGTYRPQASELAFAYVLHALGKGYPAPVPAGFVLDGANLHGWTIAGRFGKPALNLRGASFRGARLEGAAFRYVDLSDADFTDARLARAEVIDGRARGGRFRGADLTGTLFRDLDLTDASFAGAALYRTQWLRCRLPEESLPEQTAPAALFALCDPDRGGRPSADAKLAVLNGHHNSVMDCVFSPDGRLIASASEDKTVRLWDAQTGEVLMVLSGHEDTVTNCAFSPDGGLLASASADSTVFLWSVRTGEIVKVLSGHEYEVNACSFSPDGDLLASASADNTVRLWDVRTGEVVKVLFGHEYEVNGCSFSSDGSLLASASFDNTMRLWDVKSGEVAKVLSANEYEFNDCSFSPDSRVLASASEDKNIRLWDTETGDVSMVLSGHKSRISRCIFSPDGQLLASASWDDTVRLWDVRSGEIVKILTGHNNWISSCAFAPDGRLLASGAWDQTVRLWDARTGEIVKILTGHESGVRSCAFSPNGRLIASASEDNPLCLWSARTGKIVMVLKGHEYGVSSCAFSPDGQLLASASWDDTVRLWDVRTGETVNILTGHESGIRSCAFSPDGRLIASASGDNTVRLWNVRTGEIVTVLKGHEYGVSSCAFSTNGRVVASASDDKTLRIWDVQTGEIMKVLAGHQSWVSSCAFSPDGRLIASASWDQTVRLWDAKIGEIVNVLDGHENGIDVCTFSPDGRLIASASWDQTVRLWDIQTGDVVAILNGHQGSVYACVFSPDGRFLLTSSRDGTLRLWDVATFQQVGFQAHHFENNSWATFDVATNRLIETGGEAWRWLGWLGKDASGAVTRYPAEAFGPLPVSRFSPPAG